MSFHASCLTLPIIDGMSLDHLPLSVENWNLNSTTFEIKLSQRVYTSLYK